MMIEQNDDVELRHEVLLAFQAALLGEVTSDLRGVSVAWTDSHISGVFVYDGEISEREKEIVSGVEGEVISHFVDHTIDLVAKGSIAPVALDQFSLGVWVYRRSE